VRADADADADADHHATMRRVELEILSKTPSPDERRESRASEKFSSRDDAKRGSPQYS
jgi:hypothetical protein